MAGDSTPFAVMEGGLLFTSVSAGADANRPALRFDYITRAREFDWNIGEAIGPEIAHKECAFVSPRWCGDGMVTNGETCDDGNQNGQPGMCNTACTSKEPKVVSCDALSVSLPIAPAPIDVAVNCSATNATTYRIDCGNGTTHLTSSGVCRYNTA